MGPAAARRLSLQQSTLSRYLAELEARLGEMLFERPGRGLLATAAAAVVAQHAAQIEATINEMNLVLTAKASTLTGAVRISASQAVFSYCGSWKTQLCGEEVVSGLQQPRNLHGIMDAYAHV